MRENSNSQKRGESHLRSKWVFYPPYKGLSCTNGDSTNIPDVSCSCSVAPGGSGISVILLGISSIFRRIRRLHLQIISQKALRRMEFIQVLMQHDGQWNEDGKYTDFKMTGILLEMNCTFNSFIELVYQSLQVQDTETELDIQYLISDDYPPVKIADERSLRFYIQLKKSELNFTRYPICIILNKSASFLETSSSEAANNSLLVHEDNITQLDEQNSKETEMSYSNLDMIEYANLLCTLQENLPETDYDEDHVATNQANQKIEEGGTFIDKETLISEMSLYGLKEHFQFKVQKSCARQYRLKCIDDHCDWKFYASKIGHTKMFRVRKFNNYHTCFLEMRMGDLRFVSSKTIAKIIKSNLLDIKTIYTPNDIIRDMRNDYSIKLDYWKAWKCREIALELLRGKPENSFGLLPRYLHMVKQTNPGSVVSLQRNVDHTFLYAFMSLNASISGWSHCMPIMVVDATFLKGPFGGSLFSPSTLDAAGKIFPLAFSITDSENDASWNWFFRQIKTVFGVREGMCIISDRHMSIKNAIESVFAGEVQHDICLYHLLSNVKSRFKKDQKTIKDLFKAAARAYTKEEFNTHMAEMSNVNPRVTAYLKDAGFERWAVSHSVNKRYNIMTSNTAESFNAAVNRARELPVTMLMEYLRNLVEPSNDDIYTVTENGDTSTVNIKEKSCTCNIYQEEMIPCKHAAAVLNYKHQDPTEYCSKYFTNEAMLATYAQTVYPVPKEETWKVTAEVEDIIVLPPIGRTKPGRPKKRRIKGAEEQKNQNKCSRCEYYGHNRKTCKNIPKNR
ncbi:uncharacterized protein LOC126656877 [Mercurialis annua]|uniref:uncharacterized protein LOC126656877 n=1 Tax=Mercurialis annua TaxID=3986 RepID=UPI0021605398|nr:uncharacterized protein LOC126656877 [Mercurialis annua]